jgi:hypothetical protein
VYSLASSPLQEGTGFHGYAILGSTIVTDQTARDRIATTLRQHINNSGGALCFDPHHGIRIISGGTLHDLVLCYECFHVHIYSPGLVARKLNLSGKPDYLDNILTAANVPLAPRKR